MLTSSRLLRRTALTAVMALAVETALVISATGQAVAVPGTGTGAHSAATPKPAAQAPGPAEARSQGSALLMARLQNRRIEVLDARGDAAQTFANPDGSLTYTAYAEPKWVKRGAGWQTLDATLRQRPDGTVAPAATESPLTLSGGGTGPLAGLTVDGKQLTLTWPTALPKPTLSGATATYADVLPLGVDLRVTATPAGGVEETLVVKNAAAAADPALKDLALATGAAPGTTVSADAGGNLTVKDAKGRALVTSPAPVMWDSTAPAAAAPDTAPARSTFQGAGTHAHQAAVKVAFKDHRLHLAPDAGLLASPATTYPVYIDPAYVPHPASGSALHFDMVQQAYPGTSGYDSAPANGNGVGYQGFSSPKGVERTFYTISVPTAIWGAHVLSANLKTTETYSAACGSTSYGIQAWQTGAINSGTTWNNQPAKQVLQDTVNFGPACSGDATGTFDFLTAFTSAAAKKWPTVTALLVNSSETDDVRFKRFSGSASLSLTYNTPPTVPAGTTVSPSATAGYTASGTPVFSASATDANSDTVRLDYQVLSGSSVKASGSSAFANSGAAATWKPSTALPDGAYTWQVRAYDGKDYSSWSAAKALTVDTKAPGTTAVASTDYPAGAWSGTPDSSGTFTGTFTLTPPASDAASVAWTLDGGTAQTKATTGASVSAALTFRAGRHTLTAQTKDAAGNLSAGTSYVFYAGSGAALQAPAAGARPARRTALVALGKPTDTGVTYQYRRGETDTWHDVPAADVRVTAGGATPAGWPLAVTGGTPAELTWNITDSLAEDGPVDVRAVFTDGATTDASPANTVTVDRTAGTAPALSAGPAEVNALTGDATVSATDWSGFDLTVTRTASSRRPGNGAAQEGQAAVFGPQWTAGTTSDLTESSWSYLRATSASSVAVVDGDGQATGFTATSGGGWKAEPGAEDLTLTGATTGGFTLKDTDGSTTTFGKVDPSATTWQVTATSLPTDSSTTAVVSEKVTVGGKTLARPKYVIAPTSAVSAAACQAAPATLGCRVLEYVYASATTATDASFGDYAGQVQQIRVWATDPGGTASTATPVARYAYDGAGRLRETYDPRITPALKTAYAYDTAGRITTLTPPGELPWSLTYGKAGNAATAGDGMLLSASRPTLQQGSLDQTDGGTAATSLVYGVPLTGAAAPQAVGPADVAAWGQSDAPTDATALFPADAVPASHSGADLSASDYRRATVTYADASGRQVNSLAPGHHLTTTEYDRFGNTVRQLGASNRELALGGADWQVAQQQSLGLADDTPAQRAQALSSTTVYSADGLRLTDSYGPLHLVTLTSALTAPAGGTSLPAGTVTPARTHTVTAYDEGRPTDGSATVQNQATSVTTGADVDGFTADADTRTTTTAYDWAKGLPVKTTADPGGLNLVRTTQYDAQGRISRTTLPRSTGTDADTTVAAYWTAGGTGPCTGHPEWADLACSSGPAGVITGGGANPSQLPVKTVQYNRWGDPATVTEVSGGATRTTTTTYDAADRVVKVSVSGPGTAVPDTLTTYDPAGGDVATVTSGGQTAGHAYDRLGRDASYSDGAGNTRTTSYDALNRQVRTVDSAPSTTTYTYDTAKDPRGLLTSRTDSVAGTFGAEYDSNGALYLQHLPGGISLTVTRDQAGQETGRYYTRDSDGTPVASDAGAESVHGQRVSHTAITGTTSSQSYGYDAVGRLTSADDTQGGTTTHRTYRFDADTNRTGLTTATDDPDGTAGTPVATAYTYDSADRLQTVNGATVGYDAFGRTTTRQDGGTVGYYADDLVHDQTSGANRQTWTLDAEQRPASWTAESRGTDGTWTRTAARTSHYGDSSDSPTWTQEDATAVTRDVQGPDGDLAAITSATGDTVLELTDLHGDVVVQLPLAAGAAPVVQSYDEFGLPEQDTAAARYGWTGAKERSAESADGTLLMGVRLYDPSTGRFLSVDPVQGGSANAYDFCGADPVNCYDLGGQWFGSGWWKKALKALVVVLIRAAVEAIIDVYVPWAAPWADEIGNCIAGACVGYLFSKGNWKTKVGYAVLGCALGAGLGRTTRNKLKAKVISILKRGKH